MASGERRATAYQQIFGPRGPTRPPPPRGYETGGRVESQYSSYSQLDYHSSSLGVHYPQPPPQAQHPHVHPHYGQPQYLPQPPPPGPMYGPRPSTVPRPRSMLSGGYPVGIIQPRPLSEEVPDPAIERLTQQGLTPAQAYQAQYQQTTPRPLQLPLVEVTPDPPMSGPWDYERYEDDVRSDRSSIRDWASSRHSMYQPRQSPPPHSDPSQTPMQRPHLLQLDMTLAAQASPASHTTGDTQLSYYHSESTSPSPPISNAPVNLNPSASRRSIESVRTVPVGTNAGSIGRRGHTYTGSIGNAPSDRIRSMSASGSTTRPPLPIPRPQHHTSRRRPLVYPALLSRVADAFRQRIPLNDRTKDGLTYPVAFDGREAVDLIAFIIKTSDRNLALLLGRALDAQKFFHDVTYDHRLRDSPAEIYQFSGPRSVTSWDTDGAEDGESTPVRPGLLSPGQGSGSGVGPGNAGGNPAPEAEEDAIPLPVGVFTLLTECYSPTCSRDKVCYCIGCPRRVEQATRQQSQRSLVTNSTTTAVSILSGTTIAAGGASAMAGRLIKGNSSKESLIDHGLKEPGQLWVQSVPQEIVDSPIPLELLVVSTPDENANRAARPRTTLIRPNSNGHAANGTPPPAAPIRPDSQKSGYQLTLSYLGKKGYSLTLWAPTVIARKKWVDNITAQQNAMRERSMIFDTYMLSEGVFLDEAKVNCSVPYDYGRRFAYGTDDGIYFQSLHDGVGKAIRKIALPDVQQIDILEDYQLLIALAERSVVTFPLEAIDVDDPARRVDEPLKRMKRIASHTSFFKAGYCLGRTLVCVVKASSLSSTIKVLEPIEQSVRGKSKPTFKKLLQGGNDTLKVFKEFYIPNESLSIHFLKTKLCVACTTGFEIVDLETLDTQALLDPVDVSLDFVQRRDDVRPLSIYRIDGEFLLCYTEFAFFVNKSGWRSKKDVIIHWEGTPTAFALHYPYVMAFDPTFIEIRHVEDGSLVQVVRGSNLRLLFADTQPSVMNSMSSSVSIRSGIMVTPPTEEKGTSSKLEVRTLDLSELDDLLLSKDGELVGVYLSFVTHHVGSFLLFAYAETRLEAQGSATSINLSKHFQVQVKAKGVPGVLARSCIGRCRTQDYRGAGAATDNPSRERLRMIDHPIPVRLLQVSSEQTRQTIFGCIPLGKTCYQLHFSSLGKQFNKGKALTLLCSTAEASKSWTEAISAQRDANQQSADSSVLRLGQDMLKGNGEIKVNCATLYDNDQIIAYGTGDGVYFQPQNGRPRKAIDLTDVRHIEVLEDLSLLVVLAERSVFTFPLDALDQFDRVSRMSRIANGQASFFKAGTCMGRTVVCIVKATSSSSTVKALEQPKPLPESTLLVNRKLKTLPEKATKLKVFKEFYLATELYSIQFLKTKLCAAGATGFEIIDLETLNTQVLLDPADNALSFVRQHKHPRPLCVYSIKNEFLVCYREFAFYVNKSGWKSDKDVVIYWEGTPTACALHYPHIVAFSPNFVEIRHVDDGSLVQVVHKNNVQCLYTESSPLRTSIEDPTSQISRRSGNSTLVSCADKVMFLTSSSH
ncbi:unnamed protein product [Rhizoctonia solani]|uniref:CNH domain-containing protein n=1 Tax=Rhizoctonia solani TaxID=456999 RepID=A0A8H2XVP9_9AGAM|nr:unnamed protein product [Rhizoctonia solani]